MPTDLLEKPVTVEDAPPAVRKPRSAVTDVLGNGRRAVRPPVSETSEHKPSNLQQRIRILLRKIFEGHEEFLGWTPD